MNGNKDLSLKEIQIILSLIMIYLLGNALCYLVFGKSIITLIWIIVGILPPICFTMYCAKDKEK